MLLDNLPVEEQLQDAFQLSDPVTRCEAVLAAIEVFLRDGSVRQQDDETASWLLTDIVFQSERLIFDDPAFVRRQGTLVVVGVPDGLGLFLYDLSSISGTRPLLLSPWTVGLSSVDVIWAGNEFGVSYITVDDNQARWAHYVMSGKSESGWQVMWFSDEQADWWFNSRNATMSVAPYLSRLTVTGEAVDSTPIFDESGDVPRRVFKVEWLREQDHYRLPLITSGQKDRQNWIWEVAQPSAYATLVEFIEHIRLRDSREASELVSDPAVVTAAFSFGLHLSTDYYRVIAYNEESISFQGQQGAFVATFKSPTREDDPWLITNLQPLGAANPEPTTLPY